MAPFIKSCCNEGMSLLFCFKRMFKSWSVRVLPMMRYIWFELKRSNVIPLNILPTQYSHATCSTRHLIQSSPASCMTPTYDSVSGEWPTNSSCQSPSAGCSNSPYSLRLIQSAYTIFGDLVLSWRVVPNLGADETSKCHRILSQSMMQLGLYTGGQHAWLPSLRLGVAWQLTHACSQDSCMKGAYQTTPKLHAKRA